MARWGGTTSNIALSLVRSVSAYWSRTRLDSTSKPPMFLEFRSSTSFILFTVCLAIFTDVFFYGLIVPVIPFSLSDQVGVPEDEVQHWTAILLACYNAALFSGSPIAGLFADHTLSRRLPLLLGLIALGASTLLLCLGKTIALLVVGRLLQGLSAAIVWSVGLALLVDTVGRDIGYSMGYVSIAMSVGLLISPVIGGAVFATAGYYAVYYVAFAIVFCDIVLRLVLIEKKIARQWLDDAKCGKTSKRSATSRDASDAAREEEPGPGVASSARALSKENQHCDRATASPSPTRAGTGPGAEATAAPMVAKHPHWELIKTRRILAVLLGVVVQATIVFGFDTVVPLFVKDTFRWNSTAAGLVFVCVMVPGFASPLVGKLSDHFGARWLSVAGFAISIPPLVCLHLVTNNTIEHKVLLCALLSLLGATIIALATTPLMAEMTYAIDQREAEQAGIWGEKGVYGIAYGLWTTAFALGGTIGSIVAGYLNAGPGWGPTVWSLAVWAALGAGVSLGLGSKPNKPDAAASPTTAENDRLSSIAQEQV
ncbi:hypothetical protein MFIFM68171_04071 [Madurella fahalii]|uniref:Major facilitator superfamily (MFS) profile domain-containing protein n=1 Tax=Madurella fahalii TaxID=1157608 RepID=A0ABQ0G7Z0_9PEZI